MKDHQSKVFWKSILVGQIACKEKMADTTEKED